MGLALTLLLRLVGLALVAALLRPLLALVAAALGLAAALARGLVLERADSEAPGQVHAVAVGDHRVVLAELGLERLLPGLHVEADGADVRPEAGDVDDLAEHGRGAEDHPADVLLPAHLAGLRVERVEVLVLGADVDGRLGLRGVGDGGGRVDPVAGRVAPQQLARVLVEGVDAVVDAAEEDAAEGDRRRRVDRPAATEARPLGARAPDERRRSRRAARTPRRRSWRRRGRPRRAPARP